MRIDLSRAKVQQVVPVMSGATVETLDAYEVLEKDAVQLLVQKDEALAARALIVTPAPTAPKQVYYLQLPPARERKLPVFVVGRPTQPVRCVVPVEERQSFAFGTSTTGLLLLVPTPTGWIGGS